MKLVQFAPGSVAFFRSVWQACFGSCDSLPQLVQCSEHEGERGLLLVLCLWISLVVQLVLRYLTGSFGTLTLLPWKPSLYIAESVWCDTNGVPLKIYSEIKTVLFTLL